MAGEDGYKIVPEEDKKEICLRGGEHIIQANILIRAQQDDLTLLETKIIHLAISQIQMDDTDFFVYKCSIPQLAESIGMHKGSIYKQLDELCPSIIRKTIVLKQTDSRGRERNVAFHWIDAVTWDENYISFRLSNEMKPFLLGLTELFTRYEFDKILSLPTSNAIRLYELLASWRHYDGYSDFADLPIDLKVGEFVFTVDYLKRFFNCEKKYCRTCDFISRVIEPNVTAINEKTSMRTSFRKVKDGRELKYLVFKVDDFVERAKEVAQSLLKEMNF